ncbi:MAG TPA: hypothetical protein PKB02_10880 [Anaerohalosphaeraceae bacterium]|nr:hypothetical protein [Anaerohalosphaeraceae bacterium]
MNMMILAARDKETNMPENFGGLEWKDVTNIHPIGLSAVLILGVTMVLLPRRWAVLPMLVIACFIPSVQKIVIGGMDFNFLRIMVVFGVIRLLLRKEYLAFIWKPIDKIVLGWVTSAVIINTIQQGTSAALINRLGFGFDVIGMYYIFRCLICTWSDVDTTIFSTMLISIPVALAFLLENSTGRNIFSVFGGVPSITYVRDGRLRCQGAFSHAILAGCFWASLMPLFVACWWKSSKGKLWAVTGIITSSIIIICCASSTPVLAAASAVIGGLFFYFRNYMWHVRWCILIIFIFLHMIMQAPVWHLIARVSAVGGSTSWYRYKLINEAIKHFGQWFMFGTQSTLSWNLFDITNQYILEGIRGGLLTLVLFIAVIICAFQSVGHLWRQNQVPYRIAMSWALGVSLFVHCMSFIGVSYFGQIWILWYLLLAIIGSLSVQADFAMMPKNRMPFTVFECK